MRFFKRIGGGSVRAEARSILTELLKDAQSEVPWLVANFEEFVPVSVNTAWDGAISHYQGDSPDPRAIAALALHFGMKFFHAENDMGSRMACQGAFHKLYDDIYENQSSYSLSQTDWDIADFAFRTCEQYSVHETLRGIHQGMLNGLRAINNET